MTIVEVDFNNIDASGHVRVLPGMAASNLGIGDRVTAIDRLEDMEFEGTVVELLSDGGVALAMEWEPANQTSQPTSTFFIGASKSFGCSFTKAPIATIKGARVDAVSPASRRPAIH